MTLAGDLTEEWNSFLVNSKQGNLILSQTFEDKVTEDATTTTINKLPKCNDIYISTKTKQAVLSQHLDYINIFWDLPILSYSSPSEGIIKKQIKITNLSQKDTDVMNEKLKEEILITNDLLSTVRNTCEGKAPKYKDVHKISVGISSKDIMSHRCKKKGAFYNCFVMIMRIKIDGIFKEFHVKVFNTGKLEIPGIQQDSTMDIILDRVLNILKPYTDDSLCYIKDSIETILINSNFKCNFYINREILHEKLKYKYKIHTALDPCSYPGVQCKFYYNKSKKIQNGICECPNQNCVNMKKYKKKTVDCIEVSFMIFRTGSVLIVGGCEVDVLTSVYDYLKKLLIDEYDDINVEMDGNIVDKTKKKSRNNKKKILYFNNIASEGSFS
tara:strand:+ start:6108 stop:7259 length:1152 start_codon:yes stop_codon:yes gene_type:complete